MKTKQRIRALCFVVLLVLSLLAASAIMTPKWISGTSPITHQIDGFYDLPKNSVDVLFLGSCNIYNAYNPLILWEREGITCYVLGSSDQELWNSYYYLKEALDYQKPKVVVLESLMFTYEESPEPNEAYHRRAVDYMRLSHHKYELTKKFIEVENKWNAENGIENMDPLLNQFGYLFPLIRYHSRWSELTEEDFSYLWDKQNPMGMGGTPVFTYPDAPVTNYTFSAKEGETVTVKEGVMEYFLQLKELCDENGIELLLVKSPTMHYWNSAHNEIMKDIAQTYDIPFLDYNLLLEPNSNYFHENRRLRLNAYGMQVFSDSLSDYLVENYALTPTQNQEAIACWNAGVEIYNENVELHRESDSFWFNTRLLKLQQN